jgi:hypothetical protein
MTSCLLLALTRAIVGTAIIYTVVVRNINVEVGLFLPFFLIWAALHGFLGTLPYRLADGCFQSASDKKQVGVLLQVTITLCVYLSTFWSFVIIPAILPSTEKH